MSCSGKKASVLYVKLNFSVDSLEPMAGPSPVNAPVSLLLDLFVLHKIFQEMKKHERHVHF